MLEIANKYYFMEEIKKEEKKDVEMKLVRSKVLRIILLIIGSISLVLGVVGIFLPILPTVPFFLLTTFCYVRGSKKFATWFLNSKLYKKHVENFAKHRVMTLRNELILLLCVSALLLTTLYFINNLTMSIIFTCLIFLKYCYFVFRITPISKKEYMEIKEKDKLEAEGNIC